MSLDKAIAAGKERRQPYYASGRHDKTCRPHGGCTYCARGRRHRALRQGAPPTEVVGRWTRSDPEAQEP